MGHEPSAAKPPSRAVERTRTRQRGGADAAGRSSTVRPGSAARGDERALADLQALVGNRATSAIVAGSAQSIQRQIDSGLAGKAGLTPANWSNLLKTNKLNTYCWKNTPSISASKGDYTLVWFGAVSFADGTKGDLHIHMHEGVHDADELAGGGAWIDGGASGHGQNIDTIQHLKETCVAWINDTYDSNCTV